MSLRPLIAALLLAGSAPAMAQIFDISLSDDSAKLTYVAPMGKQGFGRGEVDGSILFTDNDAFMASVGFGVTGEAGTGSPGLLVGIGARLYGVNADKSDLAALASPPRYPPPFLCPPHPPRTAPRYPRVFPPPPPRPSPYAPRPGRTPSL